MLIQKAVEQMKTHPDYKKMGMIATHLGIVRENSLDGRAVKGMKVDFDPEKINLIISETKILDGIIDVIIEYNSGTLSVGEEVMAVAVGGDTREHVFPALIEAVDRVKKEASKKKEIFAE
ncbi:MAG: molybdenum cofactor biosynthesis protein MoaE [Deltaproteobacteria bacterium]|nr:MAG: molybdenum cofactor biosynthesis protein MoaE [Deltaproteobacteria bacterium]